VTKPEASTAATIGSLTALKIATSSERRPVSLGSSGPENLSRSCLSVFASNFRAVIASP
jgi:hypothetical protein